MAFSSLEVFDKTMQITNIWLKEIMEVAGWEDRHRAYLALRIVLHALRDRLTPEEAMDLGAQMPMLIRGLYYEGWTIGGKPMKIRSKEEFLERINQEFVNEPLIDPEEAARAVFTVLSRKISQGEIEDIKSIFPRDILELWPEE
jgi:uncharacterized protein (DUF2267 family)